MKGLDTLEKVRMRGLRPAMVTIADTPYDPDFPFWMEIEPHDVPERLDLRALLGLWVSVSSGDGDIAHRWSAAALRAGASTVTAGVYRRTRFGADEVSFVVLRLQGEDQCITT